MPGGNLETFQRVIAAVVRRDIEAATAYLHPDVRWHSAIMEPFGGMARVAEGHEGVRAMFRDFYDVFTEIDVEFSELRDLGERIAAFGRIRILGAGSGAELDTPWCYVVDFEAGKVKTVQTFLDPAAAETVSSR